jgi:hypothetical protein
LRFADDIVLIGHSPEQIQMMLSELIRDAKPHGLSVNFAKTKVLNNGIGRRSNCKHLSVESFRMSVVDSIEYLGRTLSLKVPHDAEIDARTRKAKAAFFKFKKPLTCRQSSLMLRIRFLDKTVTPCFMYGCASWVMIKSRELKLRRLQRWMLRQVVGCKRKKENDILEPWVDYLKRSARECDNIRNKAGMSDWVLEQRRRMWTWAARCVQADDSRWSNRVLFYWPIGVKRPGRPKQQWED